MSDPQHNDTACRPDPDNALALRAGGLPDNIQKDLLRSAVTLDDYLYALFVFDERQRRRVQNQLKRIEEALTLRTTSRDKPFANAHPYDFEHLTRKIHARMEASRQRLAPIENPLFLNRMLAEDRGKIQELLTEFDAEITAGILKQKNPFPRWRKRITDAATTHRIPAAELQLAVIVLDAKLRTIQHLAGYHTVRKQVHHLIRALRGNIDTPATTPAATRSQLESIFNQLESQLDGLLGKLSHPPPMKSKGLATDALHAFIASATRKEMAAAFEAIHHLLQALPADDAHGQPLRESSRLLRKQLLDTLIADYRRMAPNEPLEQELADALKRVTFERLNEPALVRLAQTLEEASSMQPVEGKRRLDQCLTAILVP